MRLLPFLLAASSLPAQNIVNTVAGSQWVFPDDGQPAIKAALSTPQQLAVDAKGNLYIASAALNMLLKLDSKGIISVVAGNGLRRLAGDGGDARAASTSPQGVAIDAAGNLYVTEDSFHRVRKISPNGIITNFAGGGPGEYSGDGGPATAAGVNFPISLAADAAGNVYIGQLIGPVRKVAANGVITTVVGKVRNPGFSGDGGPASQANISLPRGLAVDSSSNLYIADEYNNCIRKIDTKGIITTVAGNGQPGFGGDGGPATQAMLDLPSAVWVDSANNLYIADDYNQRIRRVSSSGIIVTVAGSGQIGFAGDGGNALRANFAHPYGLAVDSSGTVYVSDRDNHRIRAISTGGIVSTVAGGGEYTGDGGPATNARLSLPYRCAIDSKGNLYISDYSENRVRRVSPGGIISTLAGTGIAGFGGDGGPAANALVDGPMDIAVDSSDNIYFADLNNGRLRKVATDGTITTVNLNGMAPFGVAADGAGNIYVSANVRIYKIGSGGQITAVAGNGQAGTSGDGGLALQAPIASDGFNPHIGADRAGNVYIVDYNAAIVREVSNGRINLFTKFTAVKSIAFDPAGNAYVCGLNPVGISRVNADGTTTAITGRRFGFGGDGGPALNAAFAGTEGLAADANGNLYVVEYLNARVRVVLAATAPAIVATPSGLTFTSVAGTSAGPSQTFTVVNGGAGTLNWSTTVSTTDGGNWLSVTPANGSSKTNQPGVPVQVQVDPSRLSAGAYYGQAQVLSPGVPNSPQSVTVVLNVLAGGSSASLVQPGGALFAGVAGTSPAAQTLLVSTQSAQPVKYNTTASFGAGQPWFTLGGAASGTVSAGKPVSIPIQPNITGFTAGAYNGNITFAFDAGPAQNVSLLLVLASGGGSKAVPAAGTCTKLLPQFTSFGPGFSAIAGWPAAIEVRVVDDCAQPLTTGNVTVSFSNNDPPISLTSLRDGRWSGAWNAGSGASVILTAAAKTADGSLTGTTQINGGLQANTNPPPVVAPGGVLNAASYSLQSPLAPGTLISIFGSLFAQNPAKVDALPLPLTLNNTTVTIAGRRIPLLYTGPNQVNAMIPFDLPINASHQVVVQRGTAISIPEPIGVIASQSGIFTRDLTGKGAAIVVKVASDGTQSLVGPDNPARAYDPLVIYCEGLGDVDPQQIAGSPVPISPLSRVLDPVSVTVGGLSTPVDFAGLTPGFTGLYQVNSYVPSGVTPGDNVPLVITQSGRSSPPVSVSVR
jgi:uncharacterized protein (TIGR03437 family)